MIKNLLSAIRDRLDPFYRAWVATLAALMFGLGPIFFAWITFAIHGKFREHYASTLANGDALMIATALVGPALVLATKRREPETMPAPELFALVGLSLCILSVVVYINASPNSAVGGGPFEQHRVLLFTYILLPLSFLYALLISYLDERSSSLKQFTKALDTNGKNLTINFPGAP